MAALYAALGRGVVRYRYAVILAWILFGAVCLTAFPKLSSVVKTTQSDFLPASSPSLKAQKLELRFNQQSDTLASLTLVAEARGGSLTDRDQAAISRFEDQIRHFPHVASVQDFSTSPDGRARQAQILAAVPTAGAGKGGTGDALIERIRGAFAAAPPGLVYHLTGDLAISYDSVKQSNSSSNMAQLLSILVIIVLLFVAFRSLLAPIITLITAVVALVISEPIIAQSTHLHVPVSSITEVVLIVLMLGAGTDYCVFLISRMREEMANGLTARDAVARSVATVGESISFSAFTVIVALTSLLLAEFGIYQSFGPPLAIGIAVMLVAALTLMPALLAIFGRAVFWPSKPGAARKHREGLWARTAGRVIAYPWVTLAVGILVFGGLALGNIHAPDTGGFTTKAPSGTDSARGQSALTAHFPAASANPELAIFAFPSFLWTDAAPAAEAQRELAANPAFRSVVGPFGPGGFTPAELSRLYLQLGPPQALPPQRAPGVNIPPATYNAYRGLAQYFSADGRTIQFFTTPRNNAVNSTKALNGVAGLRVATTAVAQRVGASESGVFGILPIAYDISQTSNSDVQRIVPIVAVLITFLLAMVLRSLVAPLYLIVSVVLSYLAALGLTAIIFVHLGTETNLDFVLPLIMFIFLMALGSDYNILVMSRIREEAHALPIARAVKQAIGATGTTVTTAGLILGGTFAAFGVTATDVETREIGYGIAAGIILDTFLVRTLLVPSIVVLIGRWNWWPAGLRTTVGGEETPISEPEPELATV